MILMLFGAVAVAGVLGTGYMSTMKGPGRSLSEIYKSNAIENNMMAATKLVVSGDAASQDCDGDGTVEAKAFRSGAGPTGGGLVPLEAGAVKNDPWGKPLGYCVWDHGKKSVSDNVAECGGSGANRLQGGNISTEVMLTIVSAGKDGIFQTSCNPWADANTDKIADTPLIITAPGSDDIVKRDTIESLLASGALAQLPNLPDDACIPGAEGTLRYSNGVPQVCTPSGWQEIGGDSDGSPAFTPTGPVNPNTVHTSNTITTSGYFGTRTVTVDNGGILLVNGTPSGSSAEVPVGATVSIQGTSASFPADPTSTATTPKTFTMRIGAVSKTWILTTRGRTPPVFSITPNPSNNMNVTGPGSPAYGSSVQFTVTNTGEATSASINVPALSNTTNFETTGTNLCSGAALAGSATCTLWVRPKASTGGAFTGTVTISAAGATNGVATLNGTASGWSCPLPWGGTIADGASVTAYSTNGHTNCASVSQNRLCSGGVLSGSASYQYQTCVNPGICSSVISNYRWGGTTLNTATLATQAECQTQCGIWGAGSMCDYAGTTCTRRDASTSITASAGTNMFICGLTRTASINVGTANYCFDIAVGTQIKALCGGPNSGQAAAYTFPEINIGGVYGYYYNSQWYWMMGYSGVGPGWSAGSTATFNNVTRWISPRLIYTTFTGPGP